MAEQQQQQQGCELDRDQFCCPVCLDLLKEPVTLPCAHSYCISCIDGYWDQYEEVTGVYSCPQCRENFSPRPVLRPNNLLAEVVKKLSSTGAQQSPAASAAPLYAGPADVACDFCTGARRRKALMSCLTCLVSYCEAHLQPHYNVPALKKHKLVPATSKLQEKMCSSHDKLMEAFCRTDQQCICYLCLIDEHKGHDTVSAAAEKTEKQKQLVTSQEEVQQKIQEKKKELKDLRQGLEDMNSSGEAAVEASDRIFSEMVVSIERRRSELKQLIRDQQQDAVSQTEDLLRQLEQTLEQLERRHAEMEELSNMEDSITFIQSFQSLSSSSGSPVSPSVITSPLRSFTHVTDVLSSLRDQLDNILETTWPQISKRDPKKSLAAEPALFRCQGILQDTLLTTTTSTSSSTTPSTFVESAAAFKALSLKADQLFINDPFTPAPLANSEACTANPLLASCSKSAPIFGTGAATPASSSANDNKPAFKFGFQFTAPAAVPPSVPPSFGGPLGKPAGAAATFGLFGTAAPSAVQTSSTSTGFGSFTVPDATMNAAAATPAGPPAFSFGKPSFSTEAKDPSPLSLEANTSPRRVRQCTPAKRTSLTTIQRYDVAKRMTMHTEVLRREGLSERRYWELEWIGGFCVTFSYKDTNDKISYGDDDTSWCLKCGGKVYTFKHNSVETKVPGPVSYRIGVHLDHKAGTLSFYSVSDTMTLLHTVQTTFTQPLYPGIRPLALGDRVSVWALVTLN